VCRFFRITTCATLPSDSAAPPTEVTREAWLALALVTLTSFLVVIDVSVVNVAFPSIRRDLGASNTSLSWIVSGYNITVAAFLLLAGRLADSKGRRRTFMPGVSIFLLGSLLCGLAPGAGFLISARVIQALGGAALLATSLAVVLPEFPVNKRSTAIGIWGAAGSLGAAFGPSFGAVLINLWNWRLVFLINAPLCLLVLFMAPRLLRESKDPGATGKVDLIGVPIGVLAIALLMLAITQGDTWGYGSPLIIGLVVVGMAMLPLFVLRSARHPEPLLNLDLFAIRSFASTNIAVAFYSVAFTSGFLLSSLLLQTIWDLSVLEAALALSPSPLIATVVSVFTGRKAVVIGHRWLLGIGSTLCGCGYVLFLLFLDEQRSVGRFVPISMVIGAGVGMSIASWFSAGVSDIPPTRFGVATATLRTTQQVFYGVGIAVVTAFVAGADVPVSGFRRAWVFVSASYGVAAVLVMVTFPSGSSTDRT
jgi:EmrB/QacA subfamily drug resistance transporter